MLNIRELVKNISNFIGDLWLMHIPLNCVKETHIHDISGIPTTYQIIGNDSKINKFKSSAVLYNKNNFTCLEQESLEAVLYINFATRLCNFDQFSMLEFYRKNYSNIAQFVGIVTYLAEIKNVDLIAGDFNEDSLNEGPMTILFQSLQNQLISEVLFLIKLTSEVTKTAFQICMSPWCFISDHDSVVLYY